MRWCVQSDEQSVLFGVERGCAEFEQRVLRFDGAGAGETAAADDEVLYVLSGRGSATVAGNSAELVPGTAVYVAAGSSWSVDNADALELLSVLVRDPLPANGVRYAVVGVDEVEVGEATAGRM